MTRMDSHNGSTKDPQKMALGIIYVRHNSKFTNNWPIQYLGDFYSV